MAAGLKRPTFFVRRDYSRLYAPSKVAAGRSKRHDHTPGRRCPVTTHVDATLVSKEASTPSSGLPAHTNQKSPANSAQDPTTAEDLHFAEQRAALWGSSTGPKGAPRRLSTRSSGRRS